RDTHAQAQILCGPDANIRFETFVTHLRSNMLLLSSPPLRTAGNGDRRELGTIRNESDRLFQCHPLTFRPGCREFIIA
ncbi:MAG: hypothetical protein ACXW4E_04270, partial [Anaerolineales bacterium]